VKLEDRQADIDRFNSKHSAEKIFLISTRAGGMGINLTGADTVIFFDTDWNPQIDLQAADRCHRIGQTKPVVIYRLVAKDTIDERIVQVASDKRKLEKLVVDLGKFEKVTSIKDLDKKDLLRVIQELDWRDGGRAANNTTGSSSLHDNEVLPKELLSRLADREFVMNSDLKEFSGLAEVFEKS